jgi:amidase
MTTHRREFAWRSASALADALRSGETSASAELELLLERIARHNPALNAIVTLAAEPARERAREADEALARGEDRGPLHGVPVTIKDSFDTAGTRTTSGWPAFAERVPTADAPPVARLRAAGAIVLGKTNLPPLANGIQSDNRVFGRSSNPWDLARTPGGSSGGAAAGVAAGLSYLELGSDIGGSIRIPSHFCGVFGLKMTAGRISGQGHVASVRPLVLPAGWEGLLQLASFGPIARSIEDLRLAALVLAEPATPPLRAALRKPTAALRVAWTDDFGNAPVDADTRQALAAMTERLAGGGAQVTRRGPDLDFAAAWRAAGVCLGAINTLFQSPATRWLRRLGSPLLRRVGPRDALLQGLFTGIALRDHEVRAALAMRESVTDAIERFLGAATCLPVRSFRPRRSRTVRPGRRWKSTGARFPS